MVVALEIVGAWCAASVLAAFGLGPLLQGMKSLADRHETPELGRERTAA